MYFVWQRGTDQDIWRTRGPGQPPERVTFSGAVTRAVESADGKGIFYRRAGSDSPLEFQPLAGGAPHQVSPCVSASRFSIGVHGIYYVPCLDGRILGDIPVHVVDPATGKDRAFATVKGLRFPASSSRLGSFAVSPDGRTILYTTLVSSGADLMMIENFR